MEDFLAHFAALTGSTDRPRTARRRMDALAGISLLKRRVWFADPPEQPDDDSDESEDGEGDGKKRTRPETVPYGKFADERKKLREAKRREEELQQKLKGYETADAEAKRKKTEEEGRFQDIIKELEPKAAEAETLRATLAAYLETEMQSVPEEFRDLIPEGDVAAKLKWIQQARAKNLFGKQRQAPGTDSGKTGDRPDNGGLTTEEAATAKRFGISQEKFLAAKAAAEKK